MTKIPILQILVPLLLVGCGSGSDVEGGLALGALEGAYDITDPVSSMSSLDSVETPECRLNLKGSRATANCSKSGEEQSESLSVDVVVKEELISADLVYVHEGPTLDCFASFIRTATIVGSASKQSGAMLEGVFSPIAGEWTGSLTVEVSYDIELLAEPASYCDDDFELEIYAYTFGASIAGSTASVDWEGEGDSSVLEIIGTENAISVNGDTFTK